MTRFIKHLSTNNLYKYLGTARDVNNPLVSKIAYEQIVNSKLRESDEIVNSGDIWIRDKIDFDNKFDFIEHTIPKLSEPQLNFLKIGDLYINKNKIVFVDFVSNKIGVNLTYGSIFLGTGFFDYKIFYFSNSDTDVFELFGVKKILKK